MLYKWLTHGILHSDSPRTVYLYTQNAIPAAVRVVLLLSAHLRGNT
jgi:hypothetical protein